MDCTSFSADIVFICVLTSFLQTAINKRFQKKKTCNLAFVVFASGDVATYVHGQCLLSLSLVCFQHYPTRGGEDRWSRGVVEGKCGCGQETWIELKTNLLKFSEKSTNIT